jgi:5-methylthioadenosine/S-adenosylhomocysteine deaminase
MGTRVYRGCFVLADAMTPVRRASDILVEGSCIGAIEPAGSISQADEVIDCSALLAAPGLINGHLHSWDHFLKGRIENLPMEVMMAHIRPARPVRLTDRQIYARTMIGAIESLRTGATTIVDDMSLGQIFDRGHVDAALQAYDDAGIRAYLGFSMIDKPVLDSWPFVDECFSSDLQASLRALPRPDGAQLVELVRSLAKTHHPKSRRVGVMVAPSAPPRCTDQFLRSCRGLADDLDLPVMTHLLETRLQVVTAQTFYGRSMVEHLDAIGFLRPSTALIHAVWLTPRDRDLIAASGASMQYNPWSNGILGSGVADFRAAREAGINISMGSDGCGATYGCSMLTSLKLGGVMSRISRPDYENWATAKELWHSATVGGAKALGRDHELGRLAPGQRADIVFYRRDSYTLSPLNDPVRQIVNGESGSAIDTVVVDGTLAMRGGKLTRIDEAKLVSEFNAAHEELAPTIVESERASRALLAGIDRIYRKSLTVPIPSDTVVGWVTGTNARGSSNG